MMITRDYLILFLIGICAALAAVFMQAGPDYMDAAYYYVGGQRIFGGHGFTEPYIWNFLDHPQGIPTASHTYWMPLASMLAALGMRLSGSDSFFSARLVFILLAAFTPVLTAWLYGRLAGNDMPGQDVRFKAWLAGLLAIFSGFYAIYITLTETFALYLLLGGIFLALIFGKLNIPDRYKYLLVGATAGLMHLARADGIIWLGAALLVSNIQIFPAARQTNQRMDWRLTAWRIVSRTIPVLVGYLVLMAPWYGRNLKLFGSLFSPGGARTIWMTNYNQIFSYTPDLINFSTWMQAGWAAHLLDRAAAMKLNLSTLGAVQCGIVLAPLVVVGLWRLRREGWARFLMLMWLGILALMTVIFPYSGSRGGYFHAGAGIQVGVWILSVEGLDTAIQWAAGRRGWDRRQALRILGGGVIGISILMTGWLFSKRVIGPDPSEPVWDRVGRHYQAIDQSQSFVGAGLDSVVMVNNPPGYYAATGRAAVVIPDEDFDELLKAARQFDAAYIILEEDHVVGLNALYCDPQKGHQGVIYLETVADTHLFAVEDGPR
jgi:hypothetical protein